MTLPGTRDQAIRLIRWAGGDLSKLTPEEIARIRELYALDDPRSIEQRVRERSP